MSPLPSGIVLGAMDHRRKDFRRHRDWPDREIDTLRISSRASASTSEIIRFRSCTCGPPPPTSVPRQRMIYQLIFRRYIRCPPMTETGGGSPQEKRYMKRGSPNPILCPA